MSVRGERIKKNLAGTPFGAGYMLVGSCPMNPYSHDCQWCIDAGRVMPVSLCRARRLFLITIVSV